MNIIKEISEKEFLQQLKDCVSKKVIWQKPVLLLTKDGSDYNYISDAISETYNNRYINTDPLYFKFVRNDNKLEMSLNGVIVNGHHPDVEVYKYLGGLRQCESSQRLEEGGLKNLGEDDVLTKLKE